METLKHPACTVGWVARLCRSWLSPGKATRISHGRNLKRDDSVAKKQKQNKTNKKVFQYGAKFSKRTFLVGLYTPLRQSSWGILQQQYESFSSKRVKKNFFKAHSSLDNVASFETGVNSLKVKLIVKSLQFHCTEEGGLRAVLSITSKSTPGSTAPHCPAVQFWNIRPKQHSSTHG